MPERDVVATVTVTMGMIGSRSVAKPTAQQHTFPIGNFIMRSRRVVNGLLARLRNAPFKVDQLTDPTLAVELRGAGRIQHRREFDVGFASSRLVGRLIGDRLLAELLAATNRLRTDLREPW
jgi:hypothetical protein